MDKIIVQRKGYTDNSYMNTEKIIGYIDAGYSYIIKQNGLQKTLINYKKKTSRKNKPTNMVEVKCSMLNERYKNDDCNILGDMNILSCYINKINIPIEKTNEQYLEYYGASLLSIGDTIKFDTNESLPITQMKIGKNYVRDYLLTEKGGGFYIEYHNTPHFHMPINKESYGYLILGKQNGNFIQLSAFRIPYGKAIYTYPNTLHCDAYLVGKYLVVYTITDTYHTYVFRDNKNKIIQIKVA